MRNRRFKKSPPAPREHVQDASIVQHDAVQVEGHDMQDGGLQDVGELQGCHEVADRNQGGRGTEKGATVLVQDGDGWGAALYDLSYTGVRTRSRKSIRRAGR
jgi:hypothetical protein